MSQPSRKKIVASYDAIYAAARILRRRGVRTTSLANDAYLRLRGRWASVETDDAGQAQALARTLVTRAQIDRARRASAKKRTQPEARDETAYSEPRQQQLSVDVQSVMGPLESSDPLAARVVRSLFFDGLELAEVADRYGFSRSKVVRLRRRGLDHLEKALADYDSRLGRD